jgi:hypothetical protein
VNGKKHGHGKETLENGDYYEGEWVNGLKDGTGYHTDKNGVRV